MIDIDKIAIEAIEERIKLPISQINTSHETMFVSSAVMATVKALSVLQKEYEDKLRWIPVEEKRSPNWEHVLLKQSNGKITIGCHMSSQFNVEMCSDTIRVTHWRFIL